MNTRLTKTLRNVKTIAGVETRNFNLITHDQQQAFKLLTTHSDCGSAVSLMMHDAAANKTISIALNTADLAEIMQELRVVFERDDLRRLVA